MKNVFSLLLTLLFILLAAMSIEAIAQPRESVAGIHYQVLDNQVLTQTDEDVIEVREIFWYGCPECSTLEPLMSAWGQGVRGDLVLFRMPAVWNEVMALHARIYYVAVALNIENKIHQAAFRSIHQDGNPLRTKQQVEQFFLANGVDAAVFDEAWTADLLVEANVQQAIALTADYQVDKLPSVIVNGRYEITHNDKINNHTELNIALNLVVRRLRDERRSDF